MLVCSIYFAREAAGVASTRLSLRPLISDGFTLTQNLRKITRRDRRGVGVLSLSLRGANATKQSSFVTEAKMDCFAGARNDGWESRGAHAMTKLVSWLFEN